MIRAANFSDERPTHTSASGQTYYWTFTCDPEAFTMPDDEPKRTLLNRFALWYWVHFVLTGGDRYCLCKIGLSRLCLWLEDQAAR